MHRNMSSVSNIDFIFDNITIFTKFKVEALIAMIFWGYKRSPSTQVAFRMLENSICVGNQLKTMFGFMSWDKIVVSEFEVKKTVLA